MTEPKDTPTITSVPVFHARLPAALSLPSAAALLSCDSDCQLQWIIGELLEARFSPQTQASRRLVTRVGRLYKQTRDALEAAGYHVLTSDIFEVMGYKVGECVVVEWDVDAEPPPRPVV